MADAFDRFVGAEGSLASHTTDSGDAWNVGAALVKLSGVGSIFADTGTLPDGTLCSWTPPGADYSAEIVVGADWISSISQGGFQGIILRGSGVDGAKTIYYVLISGPPASTPVQFVVGKAISGGAGIAVGTSQNFPAPLVAGDVVRFGVSGVGATVTLTVYLNGTLLYTITDTDGNRIVATGSAGVFILSSTPAAKDQIRAFWAGALAGPTKTITPSAPAVAVSGTQGFTAATVETNETINWTCSSGSCSPTTGSTTTWTAPSVGSSATVTWTSADLPDHAATATVTLTGASTTQSAALLMAM